jgi:phage tail sheath gpL-like
VIGALNGQGVENGGAGQVLVKRLASSSAARATKTVANTTPVTAMTLTAKWTGTRGNLISYTIGNDPRVATNDIFTVYVNGVAQEVFTYVDADVAGLAAQINLSSKLLTAV